MDAGARILAQQMSIQMDVPFIVINKPGASFVIGTMEIVRSAPDGYTIGVGNVGSLAINRTLIRKLPYDVQNDLTLVSTYVEGFNVLAVSNDLPVKSVAELIAHAKKHPGALSFGSAGNGTTGHLGGELFKAMAGVDILHVPYRSSPQAVNDLIAGNIHLMFDNLPAIADHIRAGRVRALGVSAANRARSFPDVPAIAGAGVPGYDTRTWAGVVAPARLPTEIVLRLNLEVRKAVATPAVADAYRKYDSEPVAGTPEEFIALVRRETPKWAAVISRSGAKMD